MVVPPTLKNVNLFTYKTVNEKQLERGGGIRNQIVLIPMLTLFERLQYEDNMKKTVLTY